MIAQKPENYRTKPVFENRIEQLRQRIKRNKQHMEAQWIVFEYRQAVDAIDA